MSPMDQALKDIVREAVSEALASERPRIVEEVAEKLGAAIRPEVYLSTAKAAKIADVTPDTIREWVQAGDLKRYGAGQLRIKASDLTALLERRKLKVVPEDEIERQASDLVRRLTK